MLWLLSKEVNFKNKKERIKTMKHTLTKYEFVDGMRQAPNNPFSYEALEILWDYFENLEYGTGEELEFDPVDFRSDYSESSFNEIISDYLLHVQGIDEEVDKKFVIDFLNQNTIVLGITEHNTVVYQNF
jgi:hypothetical protein